MGDMATKNTGRTKLSRDRFAPMAEQAMIPRTRDVVPERQDKPTHEAIWLIGDRFEPLTVAPIAATVVFAARSKSDRGRSAWPADHGGTSSPRGATTPPSARRNRKSCIIAAPTAAQGKFSYLHSQAQISNAELARWA